MKRFRTGLIYLSAILALWLSPVQASITDMCLTPNPHTLIHNTESSVSITLDSFSYVQIELDNDLDEETAPLQILFEGNLDEGQHSISFIPSVHAEWLRATATDTTGYVSSYSIQIANYTDAESISFTALKTLN